MPASVLLTGFEPFGAFSVNSSWEAVRVAAMRLRETTEWEVHAAELPVDYEVAQRRLYELLETHRAGVCLCTGLSPLAGLKIEYVARKPPQLAHVPGPGLLEGSWDWVEMESRLRACARPVVHSRDAGCYVCESTYWALLAFRHARGFPSRAAFLHVPPLSEEYPLELLAGAIERMIRAALSPKMA